MPTIIEPNYRQLFEASPGLYLVLQPDLKIVAVSNAYLQATMTIRDQILGKGLFEVFPDNPDDETATGVNNLRASLMRVIEKTVPDKMPIQKYDIRRPDGSFEVRYWSPVNTPVFNEDNNLAWIIHQVEDVTEMVRMEQDEKRQKEQIRESRQMNVQLRELSGHLQNILEEERAGIAREIQSALGDQMKAVRKEIESLGRKFKGNDESIRQKMEDLGTMLDKGIETTRKIAAGLRPNLLDHTGLLATIEWYLQEFEKTTDIFTTFIASVEEPELPDIVKTSLFRIVENSLENVEKHALAKTVVVSVKQVDSILELTIEDNGIGFDGSNNGSAKMLGILNMRERAAMMRGVYDIKGIPGEGTTVTVKVATDWA